MRKLICIAALAVASLTSFAATPNLGSLKVHLDEAFRAGQTVLPAGEYSIRPLGIANEQLIFHLEANGGASVLVPVMRCYAPSLNSGGKPGVVLQREDGGLVMTRIAFGGSDTALCLINASE